MVRPFHRITVLAVLAVALLLVGLPNVRTLSDLPAIVESLRTNTASENATKTVQIDKIFRDAHQNANVSLKYGSSSSYPSDPNDPQDPNKHGCVWSIIITFVPTAGEAQEPIRANGIADNCKPQVIKDALKAGLKGKGVDNVLQWLIELYFPGM